MLAIIIVLVVLAVVMLVITQPLRRARTPAEIAGGDDAPPATVAELEAAREAKYAEIREAELDHQMGKLSDEDFSAIDRSLRAEAIEILAALDATQAARPEDSAVRPEESPSTITER